MSASGSKVSVPALPPNALPDTCRNPHLEHCARAATLSACFPRVLQASEHSIGPSIVVAMPCEGDKTTTCWRQSGALSEIAGPGMHKSQLTIPAPPGLPDAPA